MSRTGASIWTDELVAILKNCCTRGQSAAAIARTIRNERGIYVSRSAIIGKRFRLGLHHPRPHRNQEANDPAQRPQSRRGDGSLTQRLRKPRRSQIAAEPFVSMEAEGIEPRHIAILELKTGDCRYPYGDGPFKFCGLPAEEGKPYCAAHSRIAFAPAASGKSAPQRRRQSEGSSGDPLHVLRPHLRDLVIGIAIAESVSVSTVLNEIVQDRYDAHQQELRSADLHERAAREIA